jgi:hypothetical protein
MSHHIRGPLGEDATEEDELRNMQQAMEFANQLRVAYPEVEFYVPAEHNEFVMTAYFEHDLSEAVVLKTDVIILKKRDFVTIYAPGGYISKGMKIEIDAAIEVGIPVVYCESSVDIPRLRPVLDRILANLEK